MERRLLSTWNQVAPRGYINKCYCFPCQSDIDLGALQKHLSSALLRLAKHSPHLSGTVSLLSEPPGHLCIDVDNLDSAPPFRVLDQRTTFGWTYAQLKAEGFPARAFVGKGFPLPNQLLADQGGVPVFEVHARVIEGGLLLCAYYHHSVSDGGNMDNYMSLFAGLTRNLHQDIGAEIPTDIHLDLSEELIEGSRNHSPTGAATSFEKLLALCPEYCLLPSPTGPTQHIIMPTGTPIEDIDKTARIFVVAVDQIKGLREKMANHSEVGDAPSTFACLAAVTWAHVVKARLNSPRPHLQIGSSSTQAISASTTAHVQIPVNWRHRCFSGLMNSSARNTIVMPIASVETSAIIAACSSDEALALPAIGNLAQAIRTAIMSVDDGAIALRTALIRAAPDLRRIGVNFDLRDPSTFYFNTWRAFGPPATWGMPGLLGGGTSSDGVAPDAVVKMGALGNLGSALLLPLGKDKRKFEILLTLDKDSMELLCSDPSWKSWVKRVIQ